MEGLWISIVLFHFSVWKFYIKNLENWLTDAKLHKPDLTVFWEGQACGSQRATLALGTLEGTFALLSSAEQWRETVIHSRMYENLGRINVLPSVPKLLSGIITHRQL